MIFRNKESDRYTFQNSDFASFWNDTLAFEEDEAKELDYEDMDINIILSSQEENKMMHHFGVWLMSPDGGCKNMRSANQHRNVVMSVVRYLDPKRKDYEKGFSRNDLNLWVTEFENRGKKLCTIKTCLSSIKQFMITLLFIGTRISV